MSETNDLLTRQINVEIENISTLEGQEKQDAIQNLANLHQLRIHEIQAENDQEAKQQEIAEAKKNRWSKLITDIGLGLGNIGLIAVFMKKGFIFEETGTYCSKTFSNLIKMIKFWR